MTRRQIRLLLDVLEAAERFVDTWEQGKYPVDQYRSLRAAIDAWKAAHR